MFHSAVSRGPVQRPDTDDRCQGDLIRWKTKYGKEKKKKRKQKKKKEKIEDFFFTRDTSISLCTLYSILLGQTHSDQRPRGALQFGPRSHFCDRPKERTSFVVGISERTYYGIDRIGRNAGTEHHGTHKI